MSNDLELMRRLDEVESGPRVGVVELDPCKHCSGTAELVHTKYGSFVNCPVCGISTSTCLSAEIAIRRWNASAPGRPLNENEVSRKLDEIIKRLDVLDGIV